MEVCTQLQWKRAMQYHRLASFIQKNRIEGQNGIREYFDGEDVVMRMTVIGSETDIPGYECERKFEIDPDILEKTKDVWIMSDEQWEEWTDEYPEMSYEEFKELKTK